jgi:cathepsin B
MQYTLAFVACLVCLAIASHPGRLNVHIPVVNARLVNKVNALATTWTAGLNEGSAISGASREQIKKMLGSRKGGPKLPVKKFEATVDLPDNFDSRVNWPLCPTIQAVRDQSACGTCFAFGAVEAMSDRICITLKQNVSLASGDAAFCCDSCGDGCDGGYPSAVWQYWQDNGIVEEGCYPYPLKSCDHHLNNSKNPCPSQEYPSATCPNQCDSSWVGPAWTSDRHMASNVYTIDGGESAIMQEIFTNGPVETAFTVYQDFLSYKGGVYQYTWGDELGGHAVKMIGWGVTSGGVKYWIVANSWNADWGEKGFFRIIRGVDNCGFEDEVNGGVPASSKKQ